MPPPNTYRPEEEITVYSELVWSGREADFVSPPGQSSYAVAPVGEPGGALQPTEAPLEEFYRNGRTLQLQVGAHYVDAGLQPNRDWQLEKVQNDVQEGAQYQCSSSHVPYTHNSANLGNIVPTSSYHFEQQMVLQRENSPECGGGAEQEGSTSPTTNNVDTHATPTTLWNSTGAATANESVVSGEQGGKPPSFQGPQPTIPSSFFTPIKQLLPKHRKRKVSAVRREAKRVKKNPNVKRTHLDSDEKFYIALELLIACPLCEGSYSRKDSLKRHLTSPDGIGHGLTERKALEELKKSCRPDGRKNRKQLSGDTFSEDVVRRIEKCKVVEK